ncbi:hypothetical protein BC6307_22375 [Sutcliffiella cohnii]|uniref:Uncharacterized protein n=1 Tax=Sutcliffiella cohnii TaxID=33932 RepID=A0A223KWP7_9BACI|nr:hypothetical protein BC6307_22375 [Sutcliffiella cohnii]
MIPVAQNAERLAHKWIPMAQFAEQLAQKLISVAQKMGLYFSMDLCKRQISKPLQNKYKKVEKSTRFPTSFKFN